MFGSYLGTVQQVYKNTVRYSVYGVILAVRSRTPSDMLYSTSQVGFMYTQLKCTVPVLLRRTVQQCTKIPFAVDRCSRCAEQLCGPVETVHLVHDALRYLPR